MLPGTLTESFRHAIWSTFWRWPDKKFKPRFHETVWKRFQQKISMFMFKNQNDGATLMKSVFFSLAFCYGVDRLLFSAGWRSPSDYSCEGHPRHSRLTADAPNSEGLTSLCISDRPYVVPAGGLLKTFRCIRPHSFIAEEKEHSETQDTRSHDQCGADVREVD